MAPMAPKAAELQQPSRPQNAYWLWLSANREALASEATEKGLAAVRAVAAVGKLAGEKWKALPAAAKKPFEEEAAKRKAAYEKAMEEFKAAGGQPGKRRQEKQQAKAARGDKKARKEAQKASGKPSRPQNAYWLWLAENRESLTKEAGSSLGPVVGKLAGEKWKAMPPAQKKPYEEEAAKRKAAYEKAVEEWKKNCGDGSDGEDDDQGEEDV